MTSAPTTALLVEAAELEHAGSDRDSIAAALCVTRRYLDWLMDSDSFAVIKESLWPADPAPE